MNNITTTTSFPISVPKKQAKSYEIDLGQNEGAYKEELLIRYGDNTLNQLMNKKNRGTNTSFLYTMFKLSCVVEIVIVNRIIEISLFLPIAINIFLLLFNIVVVNKLQVDTYMKSCQEIDNEIRRLNDK